MDHHRGEGRRHYEEEQREATQNQEIFDIVEETDTSKEELGLLPDILQQRQMKNVKDRRRKKKNGANSDLKSLSGRLWKGLKTVSH